MASRVRVSFACNDRYGNVTDRVAALALDEEDVRLSGEDRPLTFRDGRSTGEGWVKFSRRTFTCYGAASMVGNVFWEGTEMEQGEARRLVVLPDRARVARRRGAVRGAVRGRVRRGERGCHRGCRPIGRWCKWLILVELNGIEPSAS